MLKSKFTKKSVSIILVVTMVCSLMIGFSVPAISAPVPAIVPIYRDYENYSFAERAADLVARMTLSQKTSNMVSNLASAVPAGTDDAGTIGTGIRQYGWWNETLHGYSANSTSDAGMAGNITNAVSYPQPLAMGSTWDPELIYRVGTEIGDEIRELCPGHDANLNFYSPTVNLSRDPRWGRNSESYGEDPVHSAMVASQFVNGVQGFDMTGKTSLDPNGYWKANTTMKHYYANSSENNRTNGVSNLTEQEVREYYTKVYREVIKRATPASVMAAYNRVNIEHAAYSPFREMPGGINSYSLDTLLRQTFGFKGYVTGDCNASNTAGSSGNGTAGTSAFQGTTGGSYDGSGHSWRSPTFNWYGSSTVTPAMTAGITFEQIAAWAIMGGAELECNTGVCNTNPDKTYSTYNPKTDAQYEQAIVTPEGVYTESAVDVAVAELMEARLRVGEWDDKVNYSGAPNSASTGRVKWFEEAKARVTAYGMGVSSTVQTLAQKSNSSALTYTDARMALEDEVVAKALTLLKNDKVEDVNGGNPLLPMTFPETGNFTVGVYGSQKTSTTLGLYSSSQSGSATGKQVNPLNGITTAIQNKFGTRVTVTDRGTSFTSGSTSTDEYVIAVVGGGSSAEQSDRADFALNANDINLIKNLYAANKKLIVVLITTCQLGEVTTATSVDTLFSNIPSLLFSSYLGIRPGNGIGNVLVGNVNPSARANATWYPKSTPYGVKDNATDGTITYGSLNQIRSYRLSPGTDGPWQSPFGDSLVPAEPYTFVGPNLGRTYMYYSGTGDNAIRFPLGYGLSYTTFAYSEPVVKVNGVVQAAGTLNINPNDTVEYSFKVTNTGTVAGADVAQLYVKTPADIVALSSTESKGQAYAIKRLKDFKKTSVLAPGASETVTLKVEVPDLAFWSNANKKFELMQGTDDYVLQVSRSSADSLTYNGQECGQMLANNFRINNAANWNPKVSVVSFKANTPLDAQHNIPERLLYEKGDIVLPNPTVSMANDVLYGYINRMYSSTDAQMHPIPSNITITYSSNRPGVVSVDNVTGTLKAEAGGVATITGTATDSITGSSASAEFVVYVQGMPVEIDYDTKMKDFSWNGQKIDVVDDGTSSFDFYVPDDITNVSFTSADITANYPDKVNVTVTLSPANGAVTASQPCVATVKIASKDVATSNTYKINFGKMSISWEPDQNYMGYFTNAKVRFSDGKTSIRLIQSWNMLDTGRLDAVCTKLFDAVPLNGSRTLELSYNAVEEEWLLERTLTKLMWDKDNIPLAKAITSDFLPPKLSDLKVSGTTLTDFAPGKFVYDYVVPFGTTSTPTVAITYDNTKATASITQATAVPGSATVTLTSLSGSAITQYKVNFTRAPAPYRATIKRGTPTDPSNPDDPVWTDVAEIPINRRSTGTNGSATIEASGKAKILWDAGFLYARVEVIKNMPLTDLGSSAHLKDSVELFLSENNFRGSYGSTVTNGNQYRVNYLGATSQRSTNTGWAGTGRALTGLPEGQYGYVLTYKIPWVNTTVLKQAGTVFGCDLQINAMENATARTCFNWADATSNGYNSSNLWGELVLAD